MGWGLSKKAGRNGKAKGSQATPLACSLPLISALEPRMMFDGAVAATVTDSTASAATTAPTSDSAHNTGAGDSSHASTTDNSHGTQDLQASPVSDAQSGVRKEVVFVDTRAPNYQELLKGVSPNAEVVLLSTNKDGVQQIADALAGRTGIDAIHIISHGDSGVLLLGNGPLFEGNLSQYTSQLSSIGKALSADGDILLYGCEVGAGSEGNAFVSKLANITGADIAASDDNTGGNAKGGDWDLEISTGQIAASNALNLSRLGSYDHLLVTTAVSTLAQLKSAIATGNSDGVDDVITLTGNITFTSNFDGITINVTDGHTLQIVGGGFALDGDHKARVLDVTTSGASSKVALDNITIRNGLVAGYGANESASATDSLGAGIRNSGVLTITNSSISANKASGGGGGGGDAVSNYNYGNYAGGGGGGGGFSTWAGGGGGSSSGVPFLPTMPSGITGGNGAGLTPTMGGRGGSNGPGAGGSYHGNDLSPTSYTVGGGGGAANNGSISIGGGGGGGGSSAAGGKGGAAVGGIYNASTGILTIVNSSVTNNLGAGGGGGGGVSSDRFAYDGRVGNGGAGGAGVGAIWNAGGTVRMDSTSFNTLNAGNAGAGGLGGKAAGGPNIDGANGAANSTIYTTSGGTTDTSYNPNVAPTLGNLNGDSVAWGGVGNTVRLDAGSQASVADVELGGLNNGNGNWVGVSMVVQRHGAALNRDVLGFDTAGALFTVSGNTLQAGGQTFATFTHTGGVLTITFTSSATPATTALVNDVTQRITYRNDTPAGDAVIRYTLSYGNDVSVSASVTVTSDIIYVTNPNDNTGTIDLSDGVSFREAIAIAEADSTGSQTIAFAISQLTINNVSLSESLVFDMSKLARISGGALTLDNGITLTLDTRNYNVNLQNMFAGTGTLSKTGQGVLSVYQGSSYAGEFTGNTVVAEGVLRVGNGYTFSNSSVSVLSDAVLEVFNDAAVSNLSGSGSVYLRPDSSISSTLTVNVTADSVFSGVIAGYGGVVVNQYGAANHALTLTGRNTYTGDTLIENAGWLKLGGANVLADTGGIRFNGVGVLTLLSDQTVKSVLGSSSYSNIQLGSYVLSVGSSNTSGHYGGVISGEGSLVKQGTGILTLTGLNTYTGSTTVNQGALAIDGNGRLGQGQLILDGGTTFSGLSMRVLVSNAILLRGDSTINAAGAIDILGDISGAYSLTKTGDKNLTLLGRNSYAETFITTGKLTIGSDASLGSGAVTINESGTFSISGYSVVDNAIVLGRSATIETSGSTTLSGTISGGTLIKTDAGELILAGNNTYADTRIMDGRVVISSDINLGRGQVEVERGGLRITASTIISNAIGVSNTATLTIDADTTFSGAVSGFGDIYKSGAGTLTILGSVNTYGRTFYVASGCLVADGRIDAPLTVFNGATLAGSGMLNGNVTVQSGGTLSPGNGGAGTLTVNGNLTLASGSTLALDIHGATAGTGYDRVVVNGNVDVSGATLTVNHGYAAGNGEVYQIILNDAADAITGTFSGLNEGSTFNAAGNGTQLTTSYAGGTGNDLTLTAPTAPTITSVSSSTANGTYKIGDVITVTVRFDSAVNVTGTPTLTLETGATDRVLNYVSGSGTDTLSFSYTVQAGDSSADLDYASTTALSLNGGSIQDGANQSAILTLATPGAAGSLGANNALVVDGVRPAATSITLSDTALRIGETATVTVTFNEQVTGLDIPDFSVANGSLSGLSTSDGGLTWTATFTPSANVSDATNLITLDNTGVMDQAGNIGSGTTDSVNYAIDTQRPMGTIVVSDTVLKAGQTTSVTITFNEAVTGLTTADFSVANGTLSGLSSNDGGITWTATLTPSASANAPTNLITLDNTGYTDIAGNAGIGTTDSNNYAIDTQRPTATIVVTDTALKAGQGTTVTITFSEAVSGLTTADFSVANGSLSGLSSNDGGITWTATLTPRNNVTDTTNLITLDNTGYTDAAGNTGIGTTDSNNYAIDSRAPAVTSVGVPANGTYLTGNTLDFTVNFDEAVTVDTTGGTPRLAITLDTGGTVYANYLSGSGGTALVFRLTVASGQQDSNGIAVGASLDANGATLRDAAGNNAQTVLNNVGSTAGVLVDAAAPQVTNIAIDGTSPTRDTTLSFTVTFSENVSGVDLADFALATSGSASGTLLSLVQVDARTYRVTVSGVNGQGTLGLSLAAAGSGITDTVGNAMANNFTTVGYVLGGVEGDPEFRTNPTPSVPTTPTTPTQPNVPGLPPSSTTSPLLPPPLFEQPTLGSGVPTVGNIFINPNALAPSYIAQVFASSDSSASNGGANGFLGFGGGDGGVFGTSSFSSMFGKEVPQQDVQLKVFDGKLWRGGDTAKNGFGLTGAPTLAQQLQAMKEADLRPTRELAQALEQVAVAATRG